MNNKKDLHIIASVSFCNDTMKVNKKPLFTLEEGESYISLTKRIYKTLPDPYPKYHKMDRLSKLAFLCSEFLLADVSVEDPEKIAVVFSNSSSTIETDIKFQSSLAEIPSPAIFVYTLPNIMVGEICIKNKFKGENLFFIEPEFNADLLIEQAQLMLDNTDMEKVLIGWVDFYNPENYSCFMALIGTDNKTEKLTKENLYSHFN